MAVLTSIVVTPPSWSITAGLALQFFATGAYDDGSTADLTNTADWTSADPSIASIDQAGFATGLAAGATTISAQADSVTGSAALTIAAAPVQPSPCALLEKALVQKGLLMSGKAVVAIDTPQLGRVEFGQTQIGDLERWIQQLAAACAACGGPLPPGFTYQRRRPLSLEACP